MITFQWSYRRLLGVVVFCLFIKIYRASKRDRVLRLKVSKSCEKFKQTVKNKPWLVEYHSFPISNGFFQTVLFNYFFPAPQLQFERELVNLKDGGLASIDWSKNNHNAKNCCLIFPALGTSCRTKYIRHLVHYFSEHFECVVLNIRGTAGTKLVTGKIYNLAKNDDINEIVEFIHSRRPTKELFGVGASFGSNVMVKYLSDKTLEHKIKAAVSISNPFDMYELVTIEQQWPFNIQYFREKFEGRFLSWFKKRLIKHEHLFDDLSDLLEQHTIEAFGAIACQKLFQTRNLEEFLRASSCTNYLEDLCVPCFFIQAVDDPLVPRQLIPEFKLDKAENASYCITSVGGHFAFLDRRLRSWFLPLSKAFLLSHEMS